VPPVLAGGSTSPSVPSTPVSNPSDKLKFVGQPGTYEVAANDNVEAVPPGAVRVISPAPNSVSMSPGLQIEARVALDWSVKLEVNGEQVSDKNIGVRSLDHKNQVATFTFVGISVKPGSNRIRCTSIGPNGVVGRTEELIVMGRGPARRLEIVSEKSEIHSGRNHSTLVRAKALDQWGNPTPEGEFGIETSLGQ